MSGRMRSGAVLRKCFSCRSPFDFPTKLTSRSLCATAKVDAVPMGINTPLIQGKIEEYNGAWRSFAVTNGDLYLEYPDEHVWVSTSAPGLNSQGYKWTAKGWRAL